MILSASAGLTHASVIRSGVVWGLVDLGCPLLARLLSVPCGLILDHELVHLVTGQEAPRE